MGFNPVNELKNAANGLSSGLSSLGSSVSGSIDQITDSSGDLFRAVGRGDLKSAGSDFFAINTETANILGLGHQNVTFDACKSTHSCCDRKSFRQMKPGISCRQFNVLFEHIFSWQVAQEFAELGCVFQTRQKCIAGLVRELALWAKNVLILQWLNSMEAICATQETVEDRKQNIHLSS